MSNGQTVGPSAARQYSERERAEFKARVAELESACDRMGKERDIAIEVKRRAITRADKLELMVFEDALERDRLRRYNKEYRERLSKSEAKVAELTRLTGWAQHHVDRSAPACNEFLARASEALGHNRAMSFSPRQIESREHQS